MDAYPSVAVLKLSLERQSTWAVAVTSSPTGLEGAAVDCTASIALAIETEVLDSTWAHPNPSRAVSTGRRGACGC